MALVIAHRGASFLHPPGNTVEAFAAAVAMGADWVELDVHATADGTLAVHHDHELPDGRPLDRLTGDELPAWVPTLSEALDACGPMGVNVEIKTDGPIALRPAMIASTIELLRGLGAPDSFLITSFDREVIEQVRALAPELPTGYLLMGDPDLSDLVRDIAAAGHVAINPWNGIVTADLVDVAHTAGLSVNVWTVDDHERIAQLAAFGVDGIITNRPDECREVLSAG